MTTPVNPLFSNQTFQLGGQEEAEEKTATTQVQKPSLLTELAKTSSHKSDNAYVMSLSDEAQEYLSSLGQLQGAVSNSDENEDAGSFGFLLSREQLKDIAAIIADYAGTPVTQDNYDALQQDLKDAGLSPELLAVKDQMRAFNPTSVLLEYMSGNDENLITPESFWDTEAQEAKANTYMQQIVRLWQDSSEV